MTLIDAGLDFSTGSAKAIFAQALSQIGINADSAFVDAAFTQWNNVRGNKDEFLLWLYGTTPYKTRFPEAADRRAKGEYFSEAAAIQFDMQTRQLLHSVGAPEGFLTQQALNNLRAANVSFNEIEARVVNNYGDYLQAPDAIKNEFRAQLGDDSAVIAFYLDPQHTIQQFGDIKAKALVRGYGKQFGFNGIADDAAKSAYGLSAEQVKAGLAQASDYMALTRGTLDQVAVGQNELVKDVFNRSEQRIRTALEERTAAFSDAGGGYTSEGRTGFGSARGA